MAIYGEPGRRTARKSALGITRFPSSVKWEDVWEEQFDLLALRRKSASFERLLSLCSDVADRSHSTDEGRLAARAAVSQAEELREATAELGVPKDLTPAQAEELLGDARLIVTWYLEPTLRAALGLNRDRLLDTMREAATSARQFHSRFAGDARDVDELVRMTLLDASEEDFSDLLPLTDQLLRFAQLAERTRDQLRAGPGRKRDNRRNKAIILATQAIEHATGEAVVISDGNSTNNAPHFVNDAGRYVFKLMSLLGWNDERVLVGAFKRLKRKLA